MVKNYVRVYGCVLIIVYKGDEMWVFVMLDFYLFFFVWMGVVFWKLGVVVVVVLLYLRLVRFEFLNVVLVCVKVCLF